MTKKQKNYKVLFRDLVAQGPSKSRRIKKVDGYIFPEQYSGKGPAKQGLPLSKQTTIGVWSYHREQAVKGACTVTQAARD